MTDTQSEKGGRWDTKKEKRLFLVSDLIPPEMQSILTFAKGKMVLTPDARKVTILSFTPRFMHF